MPKTGKDLVRLDGRPLKPGQPGYDAAERKALDRNVQEMACWRGSGDEAQWREGRAALQVRERKLYRQDGFPNWERWVVAKMHRAPNTVRARIDLADNFSLPEVKKHGARKLLDLLEYVERTVDPDDERTWSADSVELHVPAQDGSIRRVLSRGATEIDVAAALAHQRALAARRALEGLAGGPRALLETLEGALRVDGQDRTLAKVRVRAPGTGIDDDTVVTFHLRAADLRAMAARLLQALDPAAKRAPRDH